MRYEQKLCVTTISLSSLYSLHRAIECIYLLRDTCSKEFNRFFSSLLSHVRVSPLVPGLCAYHKGQILELTERRTLEDPFLIVFEYPKTIIHERNNERKKQLKIRYKCILLRTAMLLLDSISNVYFSLFLSLTLSVCIFLLLLLSFAELLDAQYLLYLQ